MDFLSGSIYRGKCRVMTESYSGLTVIDALQRMKDVLAKVYLFVSHTKFTIPNSTTNDYKLPEFTPKMFSRVA